VTSLALQSGNVNERSKCLSFVAFAIDSGDEREIKRWTARITPDLGKKARAQLTCEVR
jgi:hypothetical protein